MLPEVVKYRIWNLALRMNPQTAVYGVRQAAAAPNEADTFVTYNLLRVTYSELTSGQLLLAKATLADDFRIWTIYQVDLDQANAPPPQRTYELTVEDGTTWVIEKVGTTAMNQAFPCWCRLSR